ncbi:hypothetical protein [Pseudomonas nitroreducens]|uniref:hypothetical protein n=1 Tax=Pseudomonas nitroreducens TaxID=46680 RepID=UPI003CC8125C
MNIQLNELQRLLTEADSLMGSAEVQLLMRDARQNAIQARGVIAKAIKIVTELTAQQPSPAPDSAVQAALDQIDDFVARCNGDDRGSCGAVNLLRKAFTQAAPVAHAGQAPQAWIDVQAERRRQIEAEGWTLEHDDQHKPGELAQAAVAYLLYAFPREAFDRTYAARLWPWISGFKPMGERRDLERGLALGLAALERFDRTAAPAQGGE